MSKLPVFALHFVIISLMNIPLKAQSEQPARAPGMLEQAMKTAREMLKDTEEHSIWITTIVPNQPLAFHRHDQARIVVPLTDTKLTKIFEDPIHPGERDMSRESVIMEWKRGQAYRFDADPAGEKHGDLNETDKPIQVLVITFKKGEVTKIEEPKLKIQPMDGLEKSPEYKYGQHD